MESCSAWVNRSMQFLPLKSVQWHLFFRSLSGSISKSMSMAKLAAAAASHSTSSATGLAPSSSSLERSIGSSAESPSLSSDEGGSSSTADGPGVSSSSSDSVQNKEQNEWFNEYWKSGFFRLWQLHDKTTDSKWFKISSQRFWLLSQHRATNYNQTWSCHE